MPLGKEEDFKWNNAFSLYDFYGHALAQKPLPWVSWNKQLIRAHKNVEHSQHRKTLYIGIEAV